jgi:hypothetical protein
VYYNLYPKVQGKPQCHRRQEASLQPGPKGKHYFNYSVPVSNKKTEERTAPKDFRLDERTAPSDLSGKKMDLQSSWKEKTAYAPDQTKVSGPLKQKKKPRGPVQSKKVTTQVLTQGQDRNPLQKSTLPTVQEAQLMLQSDKDPATQVAANHHLCN